MPIYLNKSFKGKLRKTREVIKQLQDEQDKTFKSLCKELNMDGDGVEGTYLFDYIFNDWDNGVSFTDKKDSGIVPLPLNSKKTNGGQLCDMKKGPCACGAWH